jgi:hypothetical protein
LSFHITLIAIVYMTIVLTTTQVGLAIKELPDNMRFNRASYNFTVFSIFAPIVILAIAPIAILFLIVVTCYGKAQTRPK